MVTGREGFSIERTVCSAVIDLFLLGKFTKLIEMLIDNYMKCKLGLTMAKGRSVLTAFV